MSAETQPNTPTDWRAKLKEQGKAAFIRAEMERLGYWPPPEGATEQAIEAEAKLKVIYRELAAARMELREVEDQLSKSQDVVAMIADIRKRRIERVRAERERRKVVKAATQETKRAADKTWRQKTLPFLGHGVSGGLRYEEGDPARVAQLGLPALTSASDIAAAIGIEERALAWLTYHRGASTVDHYSRFTIPKRSGGLRTISSPKKQLRVAQAWVLEALLAPLPLHEAAMAFRPGRSILDNAARHTGKACVIRIDLKDFFPSIRMGRVKGLFRSFGYNEGVATILALLATEAPRIAVTLDGQKRFVSVGERQLPQGACTSPALTNILCRRLDARLTGAAARYRFAYTRYADDLVFSHDDSDAPVGLLLALVEEIIKAEGYAINEKKTTVMRPQHRQAVTGLVVNEKPRLSRHDLRNFRAFLHQCEKFGEQEMSKRIGKNAKTYAAGYLSFLHMVNPEQEAQIARRYPWLIRWRKSE